MLHREKTIPVKDVQLWAFSSHFVPFIRDQVKGKLFYYDTSHLEFPEQCTLLSYYNAVRVAQFLDRTGWLLGSIRTPCGRLVLVSLTTGLIGASLYVNHYSDFLPRKGVLRKTRGCMFPFYHSALAHETWHINKISREFRCSWDEIGNLPYFWKGTQGEKVPWGWATWQRMSRRELTEII